MCILRHEQPSEINLQTCLKTPKTKWETSMHTLCKPLPSMSKHGPPETSQLATKPNLHNRNVQHHQWCMVYLSFRAMSSYHGGCPTIAKHHEFTFLKQPPMQPSMQVSTQPFMQPEMILPNPSYKIATNPWDLNIPRNVREPHVLASFLRHCNTMENPYYPIYTKTGATQPTNNITNVNHIHASMENPKEPQKNNEKPQFEPNCCRSWLNGILTQIMDEQERIQFCMTKELTRIKHIQPMWVQQMQNQNCSTAPSTRVIAFSNQPQPASLNSTSMVPMKPAPMPKNALFPSMMGANPWAEAKLKHQQK